MKDKIIKAIIEAKEPLVLITIIETKGSAPRHNGSKMLVSANGIVEGTVGGGRGEYNGILEAQKIIKSHQFTLMDVARLGDDPKDSLMICGGINRMMLQYLEGKTLRTYLKASEEISKGNGVKLRTDLTTGVTSLIDLDEQPIPGAFDESLYPPDNLLILGGGYVGEAIYKVGNYLDFKVTVYDDREEFVGKERFPEAIELKSGDYVNNINQYEFDPYTYTAIVTRGHLQDAECLRAVLSKPGKYVGLIGSKRKIRLVMDDLAKDGYGAEDFARLHAPIGLDIGAETPEEIAIAIMAEIIEEKNGKKSSKNS